MSHAIFQVNGNFEVEIRDGEYKGTYSSRIEEDNGGVLGIAIPSKQGHLLPLPVGTWFIGKIAQKSNLYIFKTHITNVSLKQNVPTWTIAKPAEIEKVQRREFVRIDVRLPVFIKILVEGEKNLSIGGKNYSAKELESKEWEATVKDISGSGARIITKLKISAGTNMFLTLPLPDGSVFRTLAQVKRSELVNPDLGIYWIGVHFLGITERERDQIIRFIFKKQVELRKRSLL